MIHCAQCIKQNLKIKSIFCPAHVSIRQQYIPANDTSASVQGHFKVVMSNKVLAVIHSAAKFLYLAIKRRSRSE